MSEDFKKSIGKILDESFSFYDRTIDELRFETECLKKEIENLKNQLQKANILLEYENEPKVNKNIYDTKVEDFKLQMNNDKDNKSIVYYADRLDNDGTVCFFNVQYFKKEPFIYIIEAIGDKAIYRITEDEELQRKALEFAEIYINGSCNYISAPSTLNVKIDNETFGKLHFENDKWIVDNKLTIKFTEL